MSLWFAVDLSLFAGDIKKITSFKQESVFGF